jgi:hypothetical protein
MRLSIARRTQKPTHSPIKGSDEFDILSAIWILASNDEDSIITYEGIKYRLDLPGAFDIRGLVKSHGELFRRGITTYQLEELKRDMLAGKRLPPWIRDIEDLSDRNATIQGLTTHDAIRSQFRAEENAPRSDIKIIDWGLQHIHRLRKASIEHREQKAKWTMPFLTILVTGILTSGGTLTVQYLTSNWNTSSQIRINTIQKQRQAFGDLWGRKILSKSLLNNYLNAQIYSYYYAHKWKNAGSPKSSMDFQEFQHWRVKNEDLTLETIKSYQGLFESFGLIGTLFRDTAKLNELLHQTYNLKVPHIPEPAAGKDQTQLEKWKQETIEGVARFVDDKFEKPIDDLLNYLKSEITKDAKNP